MTVALFTDSFLYALIIPVVGRSPVGDEDAFTVAVTYTAYGLGVLLATPIIGPLTDRVGRRVPLLLGLCCVGLATGLFAAANTLPMLLAARIVQGIASTATWTGGLALVADSFVGQRTQMMGIAMMGSSAGSVLGPAAGGFLLELGGYQWPFIVGGALLLIDGILRFTLVVDPPRGENSASDLRAVLADRGVLAATLVVLLGAAGWSLIEPLLPDHLMRVASVGPATIGLMFTISTLANGLSAPWIGNVADRFGVWPTMLAGLVLMSVALPWLSLPVSVVVITGVLMVVNVAFGMVMNPSLTELAEAVERRGLRAYGAVYALYNIGYSVGQMGSNLLSGVLSTNVSFVIALAVMSLVLLSSVALLYFIQLRTLRVARIAD